MKYLDCILYINTYISLLDLQEAKPIDIQGSKPKIRPKGGGRPLTVCPDGRRHAQITV